MLNKKLKIGMACIRNFVLHVILKLSFDDNFFFFKKFYTTMSFFFNPHVNFCMCDISNVFIWKVHNKSTFVYNSSISSDMIFTKVDYDMDN